MNYHRLMKAASLITVAFGLYLLQYASYLMASYSALQIPEIFEKESSGMSVFVGFTFILMLGVLVVGVGLLTWFARNIKDIEAQRSVSLGLWVINAAAFLASLTQQMLYWQSGWGRLYITVFLALSLIFGYSRFCIASPSVKADV